jgi:hypothetical protein
MIDEITAQQFERLEAEHGEIYEAHTGQGTVLFRCPSEDEWVMFDNEVGSASNAVVRNAARKLLLRVAVHPDRPAIEALLKIKPAIIAGIVKQIGEVAAGNEDKRAKKPTAP